MPTRLITEFKEAFSLFDKKGNGSVARDDVGDLCRALGQNPTRQQVHDFTAPLPQFVTFDQFMEVLNRPGGFDPQGSYDEFIRGFRVFDKDNSGYISIGELKYVLTSLGDKLSDSEFNELTKIMGLDKSDQINYAGKYRALQPEQGLISQNS